MNKQTIHGHGNTQVIVESPPLEPGADLIPCPVCKRVIGRFSTVCGHCFTNFQALNAQRQRQRLEPLGVSALVIFFGCLVLVTQVLPHVELFGFLKGPVTTIMVLSMFLAIGCFGAAKKLERTSKRK